MNDQPNPPQVRVGELRLLEVQGNTVLGRDFAKTPDGRPVAVIGANAVRCRRCQRDVGAHCVTPSGGEADYPHMERLVLVNKEIERLLAEAK